MKDLLFLQVVEQTDVVRGNEELRVVGIGLSGAEPVENFSGDIHVKIAVDLVEGSGNATVECETELRQQMKQSFRPAGFGMQLDRLVEPVMLEEHPLPPEYAVTYIKALNPQVAGLDTLLNPGP